MATAFTQDLHVRDALPDEQPKVGQSPLRHRRGPRSSEELRANPRRRPSIRISPSSRKTTESSVSGVASCKTDKALPNINVEDITDPVLRKRARNTLAARKCRDGKKRRICELEEDKARLEKERDHWKRMAEKKYGTTTAD